MLCFFVLFFFFKQKTAYELRISDWSSDVCSSDLSGRPRASPQGAVAASGNHGASGGCGGRLDRRFPHRRRSNRTRAIGSRHFGAPQADARAFPGISIGKYDAGPRSEEHTSELQSLMRISYAVFCLKKKKQTNNSY